jgi:hypothetical protein
VVGCDVVGDEKRTQEIDEVAGRRAETRRDETRREEDPRKAKRSSLAKLESEK